MEEEESPLTICVCSLKLTKIQWVTESVQCLAVLITLWILNNLWKHYLCSIQETRAKRSWSVRILNSLVLFKIYDVDNDGFVTKEELLVILKTLVLHSLKDEQLEQIVDRTIDELDTDGDGKLNYE